MRKLITAAAAVLTLAIPAAAQAGNADMSGSAIVCSAAVVQPGGTYTCSVLYTNNGPGAILPADGHRIVIFDSGFSDVTAVSSPTAPCAMDGANPHCSFASIAPGASVQMTATLRAKDNAEGFDDDAIFESIEATDPNGDNDRLLATVQIRKQVGPDTSLSKDYRKLKPKKAKKAKWVITSTVPGSTFECQIDKRAFKPCSSPVKAKKLKKLKRKGKHRFCARAIAPSGAADSTPACDKFKVKRSKRR
jgi:hypothetical protein